MCQNVFNLTGDGRCWRCCQIRSDSSFKQQQHTDYYTDLKSLCNKSSLWSSHLTTWSSGVSASAPAAGTSCSQTRSLDTKVPWSRNPKACLDLIDLYYMFNKCVYLLLHLIPCWFLLDIQLRSRQIQSGGKALQGEVVCGRKSKRIQKLA